MSSILSGTPQLLQYLVPLRAIAEKGGAQTIGAKTILTRLSFRPAQYDAAVDAQKCVDKRRKLVRNVQNDLRDELQDLEPLASLSGKE